MRVLRRDGTGPSQPKMLTRTSFQDGTLAVLRAYAKERDARSVALFESKTVLGRAVRPPLMA